MADEVQGSRRGELEVVQTRACDYYGPGVTARHWATAPSSRSSGQDGRVGRQRRRTALYAYIEDVGRGWPRGHQRRGFGEVWIVPHAPACTGRQTLAPAFEAAGLQPKVTVVGPTTLRMAGLFMPAAREMVEMMYEFTEPMVVDCAKFESVFGWSATSLEEGMQRTVEWYKRRAG